MMRMNQAKNSVLAGLLALPVFGLVQDGNSGLRRALADSLVVLNELGTVQQGLEKGDATVLPKLLELTEEPIMEAPARDEYLVKLRRDVSSLHMQVDLLAQQAETGNVGAQGAGRAPVILQPGRGPITDAIRAWTRPAAPISQTDPKGNPQSGQGAQSTGAAGASAPTTRDSKKSFEGKGFTADNGRQARLLFKAGKYEEAFALFGKQGDEPDAMYWQARCLERQKKLPEAIEAYRAVVEHPDAGPLAKQAAHDLKFVQWSQQYQEQSRSKVQK